MPEEQPVMRIVFHSMIEASPDDAARNPFVLFVIAPLYLFLIQQRFPSGNAN
jgi:hypothetical protein